MTTTRMLLTGAGDRRRLALNREALTGGHVPVALRPDQPDAAVHDGALASVDDLAVVVLNGMCDLSRLPVAHCCGSSGFSWRLRAQLIRPASILTRMRTAQHVAAVTQFPAAETAP